MAYASQMWSFVFKIPADGFKYLHTLMINGATDEKHALSEFFHRHTNPDAEIVGYKQVASPVEHADIVAKAISNQGADHREIQPGEAHLTKAQVESLGGPATLPNTNELIVPTPEQVEAIRKSKGIVG